MYFYINFFLFLFRICLGNFNHKWYLFIGCLSVGPFFKKGRYRPPIGRSGNTGRIRVYAWKAQRSLRCPTRSQYYGFTRLGQFGFVGPPRIGYNLYKIALLAFGAVREVCLPGLRYLGKSKLNLLLFHKPIYNNFSWNFFGRFYKIVMNCLNAKNSLPLPM